MQYNIPFPHECLDELRQLILGLPDFRTAAGKRHQLATLLSYPLNIVGQFTARKYLKLFFGFVQQLNQPMTAFRMFY
jgi:hypothetical protein